MTKPAGFSVLTTCRTVDDFIDEYRAYVTRDSIFVPHVDPRLFGTECAFAILLVNHKIALAGTCLVLDVFTNANNPFERAGMRIGIKRMGPDSRRVFDALEAAAELEDEPDTLVKPARTAQGTQRVPQLVAREPENKSRAMSPSLAPPNLTNTPVEPVDDEADTLIVKKR